MDRSGSQRTHGVVSLEAKKMKSQVENKSGVNPQTEELWENGISKAVTASRERSAVLMLPGAIWSGKEWSRLN